MNDINTNALFFSNSNIELAYKIKKASRKLGINIINCKTSTELIMHKFQIQPEIIFFDVTNNFCDVEFIQTFCSKGFYYVPIVIVIGSIVENFKYDNHVIKLPENELEQTLDKSFEKVKFYALQNRIEKYSEVKINNSLLECLNLLSINKSHKGYKYLKDIVKFLCLNDGVHFKLTTLIYPAIAAKNNVSPCSVERDIRTVSKHIWKFSKKENLYQFFGEYNSTRVPTNLQLISAIVEKTLANCVMIV